METQYTLPLQETLALCIEQAREHDALSRQYDRMLAELHARAWCALLASCDYWSDKQASYILLRAMQWCEELRIMDFGCFCGWYCSGCGQGIAVGRYHAHAHKAGCPVIVRSLQ